MNISIETKQALAPTPYQHNLATKAIKAHKRYLAETDETRRDFLRAEYIKAAFDCIIWTDVEDNDKWFASVISSRFEDETLYLWRVVPTLTDETHFEYQEKVEEKL